MLDLVQPHIALELKGKIFNTLGVFARTIQICPVRSVDSNATVGMRAWEKSRGIPVELEEVKAPVTQYPTTMPFVHLLNSLVQAPETVPNNLGSGHRVPSTGPYVLVGAGRCLAQRVRAGHAVRSQSHHVHDLLIQPLAALAGCLLVLAYSNHISGHFLHSEHLQVLLRRGCFPNAVQPQLIMLQSGDLLQIAYKLNKHTVIHSGALRNAPELSAMCLGALTRILVNTIEKGEAIDIRVTKVHMQMWGMWALEGDIVEVHNRLLLESRDWTWVSKAGWVVVRMRVSGAVIGVWYLVVASMTWQNLGVGVVTEDLDILDSTLPIASKGIRIRIPTTTSQVDRSTRSVSEATHGCEGSYKSVQSLGIEGALSPSVCGVLMRTGHMMLRFHHNLIATGDCKQYPAPGRNTAFLEAERGQELSEASGLSLEL
ncbi:hypothetical protein BDV93DRAFT_515399 [Ceratobasidium sp. AG-I]|nr:hypothetical protein BDV93DRAFT_515399 [Ceratobasidium sp. AG-I]